MKTRTVYILPDNTKAKNPISWVDRNNPTFQDSEKGEFIEAQAIVYNIGKSINFDDDQDGMADVPAETKTIVIEKLMSIKGCQTSVTSSWGGTTENPIIITTRNKYPRGYVFLKKPDFGAKIVSTESEDLDLSSISWNVNIAIPADYSIGSNNSIAGVAFKLPDGTIIPIFKFTNYRSTATGSWNGRRFSVVYFEKTAEVDSLVKDSALNFSTINQATDYKVISASQSLPGDYWNGARYASLPGGKIPSGTKLIAIMQIYRSSTGDWESAPGEIDLGYVYSTGLSLTLSKWDATSLTLGTTVSDHLAMVQITPSGGLLTKNTPCWTFLSDMRRTKRGGKMVMQGTIRYLSYMADLQPEGSNYRDYEPYEIGE